MFIQRTLNCLIFLKSNDNQGFVHSKEFEELIEKLADRSLGGIENEHYKREYPEYIQDNGKNLILKNSLIRSHEQRKEFWRQRMQKFFTYSNKQWLLDQFKYCKMFLHKNSYDEAPGKIPKSILRLNPYINQLINKTKKMKTMY